MIYSCPKDFKNGKYFFNKDGVMDLLILVPGVIVGTLIAIASISNPPILTGRITRSVATRTFVTVISSSNPQSTTQ